MQPHQLIAALMHAQQLRTNALAASMRKPALQPSIHRFLAGQVKEPARSTAEPLAAFFNIPVEALYNPVEAARIAKQRGLSVVDWPPKQARARPSKDAAGGSAKVAAIIKMMQELSPSEAAAIAEHFAGPSDASRKRDPQAA
jgi:hypothetical protein